MFSIRVILFLTIILPLSAIGDSSDLGELSFALNAVNPVSWGNKNKLKKAPRIRSKKKSRRKASNASKTYICGITDQILEEAEDRIAMSLYFKISTIAADRLYGDHKRGQNTRQICKDIISSNQNGLSDDVRTKKKWIKLIKAGKMEKGSYNCDGLLSVFGFVDWDGRRISPESIRKELANHFQDIDACNNDPNITDEAIANAENIALGLYKEFSKSPRGYCRKVIKSNKNIQQQIWIKKEECALSQERSNHKNRSTDNQDNIYPSEPSDDHEYYQKKKKRQRENSSGVNSI